MWTQTVQFKSAVSQLFLAVGETMQPNLYPKTVEGAEGCLLLGDKILNCAIAEVLLQHYPAKTSSRLIGSVVSNAHYGECAKHMLAFAEPKSGDVFEMAAGMFHMFAGYGGYAKVMKLADELVNRATLVESATADQAFEDMMESKKLDQQLREVTTNYKGMLFEQTVRFRVSYHTSFRILSSEAPIMFECSATLTTHAQSHLSVGQGLTKKDAEQRACAKLLALFN